MTRQQMMSMRHTYFRHTGRYCLLVLLLISIATISFAPRHQSGSRLQVWSALRKRWHRFGQHE